MKKLSTITYLKLLFLINTVISEAQYIIPTELSTSDSTEIVSNIKVAKESLASKDWLKACDALNKNAKLYWDHNYFDEAVQYYQRSRKILLKNNYSAQVRAVDENIAQAYLDKGDYNNALKQYQQSLIHAKNMGYNLEIINAHLNIGRIYYKRNKAHIAIDEIEAATRLAERINHKEKKQECYNLLAEMHDFNGDVKNANKFQKLAQKNLAAEPEPEVTTAKAVEAKTITTAPTKTKASNSTNSSKTIQQLRYQISKLKKEKAAALKEIETLKQDSTLANAERYLEEEVSKKELAMEVLEHKNAITELEKKQQAELIKRHEIQKWFFILSLIFAAISVIFIWRISRRQRHQNEILQHKSNEIKKQKRKIQDQAFILKDKNDELVKLTRFKDGMTGMLVHDLKNPLNAIFHHNDRTADSTAQKAIKNAGNQMMNMILNILDVQKYDNGNKMPLNILKHDLKEIIEESFRSVDFLASQKNIELQYFAPKQYLVSADKEVIIRVVTNLLTNAIKFSNQNSKVKIEVKDVDGKSIELSVIDNGVGIPKDSIDKVFEMFGQVKPRKSGSLKSSGVGLTFCQLAVRSHGKDIGVESEENAGSRFWFTLDSSTDEKQQMPEKIEEPQESISYSEAELAYLLPFAKDLTNYKVYELSKVRGIIKKVEPRTPNIKNWVDEVLAAVMSVNKDRFMEILKETIALAS